MSIELIMLIGVDEVDGIVQDMYGANSTEYTKWSELSLNQKQIEIQRATMLINKFNFIGKNVADNKLGQKFPRIINGKEIIPDCVKLSLVAEVVSNITSESKISSEIDMNDVKTFKVGQESTTFKDNASVNTRGLHRVSYDLLLPVIKTVF